jgi:hypothetical protein
MKNAQMKRTRDSVNENYIQTDVKDAAPHYDGLMTKPQIAARLCRCPRTIDDWVKKRRLPYLKIGRAILFDWPQVREYLHHNFGVQP